MIDTLRLYAPYVFAGLGAAIAALAVIAPVTKSKRDDEALAFLQKVMDFVGRLLGANVVKPTSKP